MLSKGNAHTNDGTAALGRFQSAPASRKGFWASGAEVNNLLFQSTLSVKEIVTEQLNRTYRDSPGQRPLTFGS